MKQTLPKLDLNVTNRCNFRCVHCAFDSGRTKMKELSLEKIREILENTKKLGGERIDITGGEPLVRKDVAEIIKIGKRSGYKIELVTNGSLLNKQKLALFKKLGLDSLAISLDGSNYKTYSRIRKVKKSIYEKVLKNIKESLKQGFVVKINTVVFKSNLKDLPNITEFCIKNKVKEHGIYYFTPVGSGSISNEMAIEPVKWLSFIKKHLVKYQDKIKITLEFPLIGKGKLKGSIGCIANAEKYHLQILPDGNVFPCAILASYNKPVANLHKVRIKDIWKNKKLWRRYWKELSELFDRCGGYCVNFKAFKIKDYDLENYDFVCPLRKFFPKEVL